MRVKLKNTFSFFVDNFKQLFKQSFSSTQNISIGLDIGSSYIKTISLQKDSQGINITGFACEKIGSNLKDTIKKAISSLATNKRQLALSISGHGVVLRYVNLPIMTYEETEKAMTFELEKYIPFPKEEVNFDFAILNKNKNTGKMLVLIAAAKKELVSKKLTLCQEIGHSLSFIDVDSLAIANYFECIEGIKEGVCAIVNLGAGVTALDIIEDGSLVLSRDIFIGGNDFTKKISEGLNKDFEESEKLKIASIDDDKLMLLEPVFNNLAGELKVSFDFYETQANRLIDKIFITGGSAQLKGIAEVLRQALGQEVRLISYNPDKLNLSASLDVEEFKRKFNYFTIALGVALR